MGDAIKSFSKIQIYYINILFTTKRVHDISEKQGGLLSGGVTFSESKFCCRYIATEMICYFFEIMHASTREAVHKIEIGL